MKKTALPVLLSLILSSLTACVAAPIETAQMSEYIPPTLVTSIAVEPLSGDRATPESLPDPIAQPPTSTAAPITTQTGTATSMALDTPTPTLFPPAQAIRIPSEVQSLVLLGTDFEAPNVGRTDTIMLVLFNPHSGSASLVSIPRDLYVYQPGSGMQRLNTAFGRGGIDLLYQTMEYNLGILPAHWALAHLDDFSRFVDDLGGIDLQVTVAVTDPWCDIPAGSVHLSGYAALCYVRSRLGSSDIDRSRRQQEVANVLFQRFLELDALRHLPVWDDRYRQSIQTDLSLADLIGLVPTALRMQDGQVYHYQIGWEQVTPWTEPGSGAQVLLPHRTEIASLLQQAVDSLGITAPTSAAFEARLAALTASPTAEAEFTPSPPEGADGGQMPASVTPGVSESLGPTAQISGTLELPTSTPVLSTTVELPGPTPVITATADSQTGTPTTP